MMKMISLKRALRDGLIDNFIDQEESRGVKPISAAIFDKVAANVIKTPLSSDQTSGSPRLGDLPET